jgi:hypothetical protein
MTEILREHCYEGSVHVVTRGLRGLRPPQQRPAQRTGYRPARASGVMSGRAPGALLHMDVKKLARFHRPGHRVTSDRARSNDQDAKRRGLGYDYLHVVVDDHTRLAYAELHRREDAETNARTLERALAWFAELGLEPEAVMTDNAMVHATERPPAAFTTSVGRTARRGTCRRAGALRRPR